MDILSTFNFIHRTMRKDLKDQKDTGEVKAKKSYLANTYVDSYKPTNTETQDLEENKRYILTTKPGKGDGAVIVDRICYMSSMYEIVNDTPKFLKLRSDPTIFREKKLHRFLCSLKNIDFFYQRCL